MARRHWLVKSEPFKYAWDELVKDGSTYWDGVRNYEARNNLRAMKKGDLALYYHSNEGKEVVGIARVSGEHYPDPTADDDTWVVVDLEPLRPLVEPVSLARFREDRLLSQSALVERGRISVVPITAAEFARVLALGRTNLSGRPPKDMTSRKPHPHHAKNASARKSAAAKDALAKTPAKKAAKKAAKKKAARRKATRAKGAARK